MIQNMEKSHNELVMTLASGSIEEYKALQRSNIEDFLLRFELYVKDIVARTPKPKK